MARIQIALVVVSVLSSSGFRQRRAAQGAQAAEQVQGGPSGANDTVLDKTCHGGEYSILHHLTRMFLGFAPGNLAIPIWGSESIPLYERDNCTIAVENAVREKVKMIGLGGKTSSAASLMLRQTRQQQMLMIAQRTPQQLGMLGIAPASRGFKQVHNLHEIIYTANAELAQRTDKYLERTDKVYKPSQTIEFNREGELLLYSCDNIKHSTIYFKYPYCMYDCLMPLSWYIFFVNPFMWHWNITLSFFYGAQCFAWLPHVLYWKHLDKKIHKLLLLRGGKYVRIWTQNPMGDKWYSWANNCEFHLLTEDYEDFADPVDDEDFLKKGGQLKYELQVQLDNYVDQAINVQNQIIYFMKEGTVHQPEIFDMVMKGYNIDTADFTINTAHNTRFAEPNANY